MYIKSESLIFILFSLSIVNGILQSCNKSKNIDEERFLVYKVDPKSQDLRLYWKDDSGVPFQNIYNLKRYQEDKDNNLVFGMNGGMYKENHSPKGLFINEGKIEIPLDTLKQDGNFYLHPNGVFYICTNRTAGVCQTQEFVTSKEIKYATQSGPMLIFNDTINPLFNNDSRNLHIRNGVGIMPDKRLVFIQSKEKVTFYELAQCFKKLGCKNALYLDGFVSKTYLPEKKWKQLGGDFGVIIGITESKRDEKLKDSNTLSGK